MKALELGALRHSQRRFSASDPSGIRSHMRFTLSVDLVMELEAVYVGMAGRDGREGDLIIRDLRPGRHDVDSRRASSRRGWNSSTGLPDGSSTMICLPPTPLTISFRNRAPALRSLSTV